MFFLICKVFDKVIKKHEEFDFPVIQTEFLCVDANV